LKVRDSEHDASIREFQITNEGLVVGDSLPEGDLSYVGTGRLSGVALPSSLMPTKRTSAKKAAPKSTPKKQARRKR
jgi:hypothetical protein